MEIRTTCDTKDYVNIKDLNIIQGQLKTLTQENYAKLKNSILSEGFSFPLFVWEHDGRCDLIDGSHRYLTLKKLSEEGYDIPNIPVVKITAKDLSHAKKLLLLVTSSYAKIDSQGLYTFLDDVDWSLDELSKFELEGINMDNFLGEFFKEDLEDEDDKEPKAKGFVLEITFPNDLELNNVLNEMLERGYITKVK